jgi:DeoR/GlpR family transcriptional regulator of sugar metabolism
MIQRSKVKIVLADHTKFNRLAPIKICDLSEIDKIITSDGIEEKIKQKYEDYGIEIIVAKTNKDE